jgi:peptidyl-prolyl cis-trans isomerase SurA
MNTFLRTTMIMLLVAAAPAAVSAAVIDGIAAIVNDDIVTTHEVDKASALMARDEARKSGPATDKTALQTLALDQIIDKNLIEQKIRELDIRVSDEDVHQAIEDVKKQNNLTQEALVAVLSGQGLTFDQYRAQMKEQLEQLRLMGQEVRAKIQVGERELRDYYEADKKRFSEEKFQARHIFFQINEKTPPDDVKKIMHKAMDVLQDARSGKNFADLAKTYSEDALTAKDGGELGTFKKGEMLPEIETAVTAMQPGQISDLVITPSGFHIIELEKRFVSKTKTFDEVKGELEEQLYRKKSEERFHQWLAELRKAAAIDRRL